jgi:hypothetical protein
MTTPFYRGRRVVGNCRVRHQTRRRPQARLGRRWTSPLSLALPPDPPALGMPTYSTTEFVHGGRGLVVLAVSLVRALREVIQAQKGVPKYNSIDCTASSVFLRFDPGRPTHWGFHIGGGRVVADSPYHGSATELFELEASGLETRLGGRRPRCPLSRRHVFSSTVTSRFKRDII